MRTLYSLRTLAIGAGIVAALAGCSGPSQRTNNGADSTETTQEMVDRGVQAIVGMPGGRDYAKIAEEQAYGKPPQVQPQTPYTVPAPTPNVSKPRVVIPKPHIARPVMSDQEKLAYLNEARNQLPQSIRTHDFSPMEWTLGDTVQSIALYDPFPAEVALPEGYLLRANQPLNLHEQLAQMYRNDLGVDVLGMLPIGSQPKPFVAHTTSTIDDILALSGNQWQTAAIESTRQEASRQRESEKLRAEALEIYRKNHASDFDYDAIGPQAIAKSDSTALEIVGNVSDARTRDLVLDNSAYVQDTLSSIVIDSTYAFKWSPEQSLQDTWANFAYDPIMVGTGKVSKPSSIAPGAPLVDVFPELASLYTNLSIDKEPTGNITGAIDSLLTGPMKVETRWEVSSAPEGEEGIVSRVVFVYDASPTEKPYVISRGAFMSNVFPSTQSSPQPWLEKEYLYQGRLTEGNDVDFTKLQPGTMVGNDLSHFEYVGSVKRGQAPLNSVLDGEWNSDSIVFARQDGAYFTGEQLANHDTITTPHGSVTLDPSRDFWADMQIYKITQ
ncbi:MAG: hypothetical protein ABIA93_07625 [Candidatus Woesearchaeota archaeon]